MKDATAAVYVADNVPDLEESVRPTSDFLPPWVMELLTSATGTAVMIGLIICVIGFVIAGVLLVVSRGQGQNSDAKTRPLQVIAATILIAAAPTFVTWFADKAGDDDDDGQQQEESDANTQAGDDGGVVFRMDV